MVRSPSNTVSLKLLLKVAALVMIQIILQYALLPFSLIITSHAQSPPSLFYQIPLLLSQVKSNSPFSPTNTSVRDFLPLELLLAPLDFPFG
ncbi:hypothetical protein BKA64DRAFT_667614 [Cadophora sp. MPI-SDFR-AT-0126]|nr:hypothetical protein BKA64DRAFT_667614 [Leotiomycetes sp. MPI-SDFR-AT-0126]